MKFNDADDSVYAFPPPKPQYARGRAKRSSVSAPNFGGRTTNRQSGLLKTLLARHQAGLPSLSTAELVKEAGFKYTSTGSWAHTLDILKHNLRIHPGTHGLPAGGNWQLIRDERERRQVYWELVDKSGEQGARSVKKS